MNANEEFSVYSSSPENDQKALDVLSELLARRQNVPWKEIKSRAAEENEFAVLMDTASQLATSSRAGSLFRKHDDANDALVSIWLGRVMKAATLEALRRDCSKYRPLDIDALRRVATLSRNADNVRALKDLLLKEFGIVLVFEKHFTAMKLDGVATRLSNGLPVVGLSLRYNRYDNFWFSLMHELSHVALHYDRLAEPICDDFDLTSDSDVELEANQLASDSLIPRRLWQKANLHRSSKLEDLMTLAAEAQTHPAIVAGMFRRHRNNYKIFSEVVHDIDTRGLVGIE